MKRSSRSFGFVLARIVLYFLVVACAAQPIMEMAPPTPKVGTVAILDFEERSIGTDREVKGLARTLTDRVTEALIGRPDVSLIDRESLRKILEELSLSSSNLVRPDEQLKLGRLLGAQFLITGGVMVVGGDVRVDGRIIEVETGQVHGTFVQGSLSEWDKLTQDFSHQIAEVLMKEVK